MKNSATVIVVILFVVLFYSSNAKYRHLLGELEQLQEQTSTVEKLNQTVPELGKEVAGIKQSLYKLSGKSDAISPAIFNSAGNELNDPFLGPAEAEVILMAFINYQCKPCRQFKQHVFPEIKKDFIDTDKVKYILRDFPLSTNPQSSAAANLAHCAGEQGAYWEMHDILFEEATLLDEAKLDDVKGLLGNVDQEKLSLCAKSTRYKKELEDDIADATALGAKGVPAFFIGSKQADGSYGGVFVRGAQPYPVLKAEIEQQLG